jgi:hypothetical protein
MLLGVAGDCIIDDIKFGKTPIELLAIDATVFRNLTTVNFPTAAVKRPGIVFQDNWDNGQGIDTETGEATWQVVSTDDECDEMSAVLMFQGGIGRTTDKGSFARWQVSFDIEYRAAGTSTWYGFFRTDGSGNTASWRNPAYALGIQTGGDNRFHIRGETHEPFFVYFQRRTERDRYELRIRLHSNDYWFDMDGKPNDGKLDVHYWPRDRQGLTNRRGGGDVVQLASDPVFVQFAAFRDEPAVQGFTPGLSGVDILLNDQTTKSDESSRISFRCRRQIPTLSGGARTASTTTSNPVAIALDLLTGPLAGDTALSDAKIDFPSWQSAYDYCNEIVDAADGTTEVRNRCDVVLDRAGVSRLEQVQEIFRNCRITMFTMDGKYHLSVDKKRTAAVDLFTEAEIL